jgi:hypothetical protein
MLKTVGNPSTRYGDQTIVDGNLVFGTAAKGIDFSINSNAAGATSELLNDYETGTWTPTIGGTGSNPTATYSTQVGNYTKIGNMVYFVARIGLATYSGGSGTILIRGLPFVIGGANNQFTIMTHFSQADLDAGYTTMAFRGLSGETNISLEQFGDNVTASGVLVAAAAAGTTFMVNGCYYV